MKKSKYENSELQKLNYLAINEFLLFVNIKSSAISSPKINLLTTSEIVSKIIKIYTKQIDDDKFIRISEALKLLSINIQKHIN